MNGTALINKLQMIKTGDSFNQLVTIAVLCYVRIDYKIWFDWEKKSREEILFAYVLLSLCKFTI